MPVSQMHSTPEKGVVAFKLLLVLRNAQNESRSICVKHKGLLRWLGLLADASIYSYESNNVPK